LNIIGNDFVQSAEKTNKYRKFYGEKQGSKAPFFKLILAWMKNKILHFICIFKNM